MNITLAVSPRGKLGMKMGIMTAMTTLGPSLVIVLSGALLTFAPWRTLMWVFAVLVVLVLITGAIILYTVVELGRPVLDVASFLLIAVGLIGILYGVSAAFGGNILVSGGAIIVGLLFQWAFIRRQNRIENPLIDLRPFKSAAFNRGVAMTMLGLLFVFAMNVIIPLFLQAARGTAPLAASLTLAPGILLTVVLGPIAGRWFDRFGGGVSIPLGFIVMAVFVGLVGLAAGQTSLVIFGALYVPAVLATAFVPGPSQTFALSNLDQESSPHGVTVVSTSFQIAGGVGTSLAAGIYGMVSQAQMTSGYNEVDSVITGFRAAAALVIVTSLIGVYLAIRAYSARKPQAAQPVESTGTVAGLMKTDVYSIKSESTVLEALYEFTSLGISGAPVVDQDNRLVGFISDGDILRYLSAAHPSSANIYSFAIGADKDLEQAMQELGQLNVMRLATKDVISLPHTATVADAVAALSDANLKKAPITNGQGHMVGIVSRSAINRLAILNYLEAKHEEKLTV
jgi:DHA2 family lincomycin resistance protein-like MFS transporter